METKTEAIRAMADSLSRAGKSVLVLASATAKTTRSAQEFARALGENKRRRKPRWPIWRQWSRKQRIRRERQWRRKFQNEMGRRNEETLNAAADWALPSVREAIIANTRFLIETVAHHVVLRSFETRFSGGREHVTRTLNLLSRRCRGRAPFTGESGRIALGHSFLARRDAEKARLDKLKSAGGAGFGVAV